MSAVLTNVVPFEADPVTAQRIRTAIRAHVADRNARDSILADRLDRLADDAKQVAGELRGRGLELPL
jgi:hypothetical protein